MKSLYLIRHAKANKLTPGLKDKDRALNNQGKKDAEGIGDILKKSKKTVFSLYSSPAKRARDTATVIAKKIGLPVKNIKIVYSLYRSNIFKLLKIIKKIDDTMQTAFIIGHNPEFLKIVNYFNPHKIKKFPPCGVFKIEFDVGSWHVPLKKRGKIVSTIFPKESV